MGGNDQIKRRLYCRRPSRRSCEAIASGHERAVWPEAGEPVEAGALAGMPDEWEIDGIDGIDGDCLEQASPAHHQHHLLTDQNRMCRFKSAIDYAVKPGAKVLELGGGTGALSWLAAASADKVWCVEFNAELVGEARRMLALNPNGHKVEVVHADAFDYLPPEPVDVVICEMIHAGMLREKQLQVIESFKRRYLRRFGGPLPVFLPEAVIMAAQPLQQQYRFEGFHAPIVQFQPALTACPDTVELAAPAVYSILDFNDPTDPSFSFDGRFVIARGGTVNAVRFVTKNILAVVQERSTTIDWLSHHMTLPLATPITAAAGDLLQLSFEYRAGASIPALRAALRARVIKAAAWQALPHIAACA